MPIAEQRFLQILPKPAQSRVFFCLEFKHGDY